MRWCMLMLCAAATAAQAEGWSGQIGATSQRVERGLSQSGGSASVGADLEWAHRWGAFVGLGVASVDEDQFGGARWQWSPRLGWRGEVGAVGWLAGFSGHVYPGADGTRLAELPPRAAAAAGQAQPSNLGTAELNLALSAAGLTLAFDRTLTDYYGIGEQSEQTGPLGQRVVNKVADSVGSWHVGLSYRRAFDGGIAAWGGVGRQVVKNFDALNYNDWHLGASVQALALTWALEAGGSNASSDRWRVRDGGGQTRSIAGEYVSASVAWVF